jgi:predicted ester cyclase
MSTPVADRKRLVHELHRRLDAAPAQEVAAVWDAALTPGAVMHTVHPLNDLSGAKEVSGRFWSPLRAAFPDLERRTYILMGGRFADADWVCATGVLEGTFQAPFLGVPATEGLASLRFGEFYRIEGGRIAEIYAIYDLIDLMRQAGLNPLPEAPAGRPDIFPAPASQDGLQLGEPDPEMSKRSLDLVESMIFGLKQYDQSALKSMGMERFWSPKMSWYGPGGIGSNRGLKGFERYHQKPFLTAFPDRVGGHHKARFGDGPYVASTGWPSIHATHVGPWLGVPGHGQAITQRVMDWWRCEGDRLKENWVFIDVPHVLLQSGYDVFARLEDLAGARAA